MERDEHNRRPRVDLRAGGAHVGHRLRVREEVERLQERGEVVERGHAGVVPRAPGSSTGDARRCRARSAAPATSPRRSTAGPSARRSDAPVRTGHRPRTGRPHRPSPGFAVSSSGGPSQRASCARIAAFSPVPVRSLVLLTPASSQRSTVAVARGCLRAARRARPSPGRALRDWWSAGTRTRVQLRGTRASPRALCVRFRRPTGPQRTPCRALLPVANSDQESPTTVEHASPRRPI